MEAKKTIRGRSGIISAQIKKENFCYFLIAVALLLGVVSATPARADCYPAPSGLVGWWRAEGNANDSVAGNNGILQNVGFTNGVVGQAFVFYGYYNSPHSQISIPDQPIFELTDSLSIEGWINPAVAGNYPIGGIILWRGDCRSGYDPYFFKINADNTLGFYISDASNNTVVVNTSTPLANNQWYHVAATLDGNTGTMSIYTNGVLVAQTNTTMRPFGQLIPSLEPTIGIGNVGTPCWDDATFNGDIDEISLYSRALSQSEIQAIYNAGSLGKCQSSSAVAVIKTDDVNDGDCVGPGREITYTIDYNYPAGPNCPDINDVNIVDHLPNEVEFISATGNYEHISGTVIWNIGTLHPGDFGSVTLKVKVKCAQPGSTITNECEIKDGNQTLGTADESTPVCPCPNYPALTKVDDVNDGDCVGLGDNITYSICYDANGYGDANVVITDTLPPEVNFVSATGGGIYNSGTVIWNIGTLEPNESGCVTLTVKVKEYSCSDRITNHCQMSGDCICNITASESTPECPPSPPECTICVDATAIGANNGTSWPNAYKYLQDALIQAQTMLGSCSSVKIWVAAGTYKPDCNSAVPNGSGDRDATFRLINNVAIYGGFPSGGGAWECRDPNTYKPILSGDIGTPNVNTDNSYHVVTANSVDETAVLDGFTVTGGYANYPPECGGGMYNLYGSPTITNCIFSGNSIYCEERDEGDSGGSGMYNEGGNPTVTNCTFSGNWTSHEGQGSYGGGMYNKGGSPIVTNCTFSSNSADGGGGMGNYYGNPTITNCTFSSNWGYGGGMYNKSGNAAITNCIFSGNSGSGMSNGGNAAITNCTFSGNSAQAGGGVDNGGDATITNCTFNGNLAYSEIASGYGGGMANGGNATITNCTFSGNWAYSEGLFENSGGYGGGMCNLYGNLYGNATIINCTFSGNSAYGNNGAYGYGGGICGENGTTNIINCILYGDTASSGGNEIALPTWFDQPSIDVNYSDVEGGQVAVYDPCNLLNWGPGNIDANPLFVSPPGNLRLQAGSPCIDAGDNNSVPPYCRYADLDGRWRIADGNGDGHCVVDMGAYEFPSNVYVHIGDFDNSCDVDFQDFAILASAWLTEELQTNYKPICDISQPADQKINMLDLEVFCEHWLEGT